MKNTTTDTGKAAANLVREGLEVNAEIALEEPRLVQGLDAALLKLVEQYGLKMVLATIHDAAYTAAEVRDEDCFIASDTDDMAPFRAGIFAARLGRAIEALK